MSGTSGISMFFCGERNPERRQRRGLSRYPECPVFVLSRMSGMSGMSGISMFSIDGGAFESGASGMSGISTFFWLRTTVVDAVRGVRVRAAGMTEQPRARGGKRVVANQGYILQCSGSRSPFVLLL